MKKSFIVLLSLICFLSIDLSAQTGTNPNGVSFKRLFMDYQSMNGGAFTAFKDYSPGWEVAYLRNVSENLRIAVPLKIGVTKIDKEIDINEINRVLLGLDAQVQYAFPLGKLVTPYILGGVGFVSENMDTANFQVPIGAGFDLRLAPQASINWQSEFRYSTGLDRNNFHHAVGFRYFFDGSGTTIPKMKNKKIASKRGMDSDGDGIPDELDLCPQIAGIEAFVGCPDTDEDGIEDSKDECPSFPGSKIMNGCPDTDNDGVSDNDDECPSLPGPIASKGCPGRDSDGDGVMDDDDKCPSVKGTVYTNGCPDGDGDNVADYLDKCPLVRGVVALNGCPDTDGDGVSDIEDRCPNNKGSINNYGCPNYGTSSTTTTSRPSTSRPSTTTAPGRIISSGPDISFEDRRLLDVAMKEVNFDHNRATLQRGSFDILDQVADLLRRNPSYNLVISGYTDNTGRADHNLRLSDSRAKACYLYLNQKGIPEHRMSYKGYGIENPIDSNDTKIGRANNRRVEFRLTY